jgi:hypothetical protein
MIKIKKQKSNFQGQKSEKKQEVETDKDRKIFGNVQKITDEKNWKLE